ncbi:hypothetical protein PYH37_006342 (plasmid) [Sinorhizobium numidicum]|uniref:Bacterial transcriptional activator domain-containing protein n=1 Tax=Sinorhizobium numidicum TaxID=680248 RepID=A0ABY8D407_9HYPH|nr:BTAD domain-containing putative transcriptional regulator [Sinorhizobium numidicum]WEX79433.1 hypothetical protein PYH37_006342 [Sinorhizobium numidicum]WEX85611.1 hypothetical protein PYH38_006042 [Sinorhizobium numidicum]
MAALRVEVLGGLDVQTESGPIGFATRKALALFTYLALDAGRTHGRTQLHGLLWGDCEDRQARGSLRYALTDIRKALGQYRTALCTDRDRVSLKPEDVAVDASEFERLARSQVPAELRRAVALYRGDLLTGVEIRAPAFNEWLEEERERLRGLVAQALGRLLEMEPDYDLAQRLLALDPFNEIAHRALMRHYAEQKQWTLAMRQFDACAALLKRELGVAPEAATCSLRETILNRRPASGGATSSPAGTASNFGPPGIAVSTFGCIDAVPETAAMASGRREAVATELARFRDVNVFRDRSADDAHFSLEATLQRLGSRLRLTATKQQ